MATSRDLAAIESMPPPIDVALHKFFIPQKEIYNAPDIKNKWEKSLAYHNLLGFICALNDAVKGVKTTDPCPVSQITERLVMLLNTVSQWIDEIPPVEQPQRFGNKAFRDFFKKLQQEAENLVGVVLDDLISDELKNDSGHHPAVPEIAVYLVESVGNSTRIDYGTGHELAFTAFLCCLFQIGALKKADSVAAVIKIFQRYIETVRKLQLTYKMEPAGSHGVWSLDDFQFIPFIWGSSQLSDHPTIQPSFLTKEDVVNRHANDYMFLNCIQHILQVKTGPFAEHSNQLWNISGVPSWTRVNSGLIKMYKAELMAKFPVVQHFLFGSLLSIKQAPPVNRLTSMPPPSMPHASFMKPHGASKPPAETVNELDKLHSVDTSNT